MAYNRKGLKVWSLGYLAFLDDRRRTVALLAMIVKDYMRFSALKGPTCTCRLVDAFLLIGFG